MNEEVIVIGGGLAGLTAANFLARAGRQVMLLERSHSLGGRAATTSKDGISFNLGPHALYRAGQGAKILRELGVEFSGNMPKVSGNLAIDGGRKQTLPGGLLSLLSTRLLGAAGKLEAARWLAALPKIDARRADRLTVREWLDREVRHQDARRLLEAFFRVATYANDPDRQSAGAAISQFQMAVSSGVLYLDGGWQTLVDGLRAKAEAAGVKIVGESRVVKIERDAQSGRVTAVRLADGASHRASTVIIAASPAKACAMVEGGPFADATALGQWAATAIPVKAACLDVALARLPRANATFALGIDQPLYFSVHSAAAKLAPSGNAVIHAAKYIGSENAADPKAVERELEGMFDLIQPGWRELVIERRFLPSLTVAHALPTAAQGGLGGRPDVEVPGIEGLYVAGDWVGAEGWLADASIASGKRAAQAAVKLAGKEFAAAA